MLEIHLFECLFCIVGVILIPWKKMCSPFFSMLLASTSLNLFLSVFLSFPSGIVNNQKQDLMADNKIVQLGELFFSGCPKSRLDHVHISRPTRLELAHHLTGLQASEAAWDVSQLYSKWSVPGPICTEAIQSDRVGSMIY